MKKTSKLGITFLDEKINDTTKTAVDIIKEYKIKKYEDFLKTIKIKHLRI